MKWLIFVLTIILTTSFVYAGDISSEFPGVGVKQAPPPDTTVSDKNRQWITEHLPPTMQRIYSKHFGSVEPLYTKITVDIENAKSGVIDACFNTQDMIDNYTKGGFSAYITIRVCHDTLAQLNPGSSYNPNAGGVYVSKNTVFYLNPGYPPEVTKVVYQGDYVMTVIPDVMNGYVITISVPKGGSAQFTIDERGITNIQDISTIYNIERAFLTQNVKITQKQIVMDLLDYYRFIKQKNKFLSADSFIISMLASIPEQQKFVEFVMSKKSQSNLPGEVNKPENPEKPNNSKKKK